MGKRVKIRMGSPTEVGARVQGSDLYSVALKWSDGKLCSGCDCPFFEEHGNLCKHIWATILEAWEQGHLGEVTAGSLADAIIGAENNLVRDLTREDIELLLS